MQPALALHRVSDIRIRPAEPADLAPLAALEARAFRTDRISRRGFRRFLASPSAAMLVAVRGEALAGYALALVRANTGVARLYSIAVAPDLHRRGAARRRRGGDQRARVHDSAPRSAGEYAAAIARYRKAGYAMFGRHSDYYQDRGHALRFEKRLTRT
jgi:ribosomal protein S18 acetylase RimI-like enzyme